MAATVMTVEFGTIHHNSSLEENSEKVYFKTQILVQEYWTILDHFCVPVL